MPFDLQQFLKSRVPVVDLRLAELLTREAAPPLLLDAMRYSLMAPGKRLRPILVLFAAQAAGGTEEHALSAGCAAEMIHTYSLIHDDLPAMDDDDLRRGLPTCHKKFGEAMAILAGDGLLTLAFQVLADHYPARTAVGCVRELSRGSGLAGMVGGQVEDLAWERSTHANPKDPAFPRTDPPRTLDALERIHHHKTGALFRACLRMGAWTAQGEEMHGPEADLLARLETFGRCFGLVFQITDDLIDVEGNATDTGKNVRKDATRGKLTYPSLMGVEESRRHAERLREEANEAVAPLGDKAAPFRALMEYVIRRDR